jgi:CheY-like chemotaxis protein
MSRQVAETWTQYIQADRQRLKQVILNLLSNAIKYNREGGSVTVSCAAKAGGRLRMEVKDTGLGIPEKKMSLLFSPFERLGAEDTNVEGSGVGLALSKKLVEAMGGLIGAESEFGQGSIFWVEFPLIEGQMQRYERCLDPEPLPIAESCRKPMTVLYVEDNLSNSLLMETVFATRPGIKLLTAMQGRMGLDLAREHMPDLILLDLHLPDMHGDEVLRQLRADRKTKDIPVAIVSADATPGQIERLLAAGARSYLTKPLDIKNLLAFVDETSAQVKAARTDRDPRSRYDGHFESAVEYSPRNTR